MNGAQALVGLLEQHGVTRIFGIPGAKIDSACSCVWGVGSGGPCRSAASAPAKAWSM